MLPVFWGGQTCEALPLHEAHPRQAPWGWQDRCLEQENRSRSVAAASLAGGRMESPSGGVKGSCRHSSCFALLNSAQHYYLFFFLKASSFPFSSWLFSFWLAVSFLSLLQRLASGLEQKVQP